MAVEVAVIKSAGAVAGGEAGVDVNVIREVVLGDQTTRDIAEIIAEALTIHPGCLRDFLEIGEIPVIAGAEIKWDIDRVAHQGGDGLLNRDTNITRDARATRRCISPKVGDFLFFVGVAQACCEGPVGAAGAPGGLAEDRGRFGVMIGRATVARRQRECRAGNVAPLRGVVKEENASGPVDGAGTAD